MLAGGPMTRQFAYRSVPIDLPEHDRFPVPGEFGEAAPLCPHCGCHLRSDAAITYGNIAATEGGDIVFDGSPVFLPRRLHDIALALVRARGRALTRSQLAFGLRGDTSDEAIVKSVERLRRHFRQLRHGFDQIETVRGFGAYRWRLRAGWPEPGIS